VLKDKEKKMIATIAWIIVLIMNIILCAAGGTPSWLTLFCALGALILDGIMDIFINMKQ
jgi:hypothetical protein